MLAFYRLGLIHKIGRVFYRLGLVHKIGRVFYRLGLVHKIGRVGIFSLFNFVLQSSVLLIDLPFPLK